jgi:hypothetical protein
MEIVYLKLINGDELFGQCVGEENGQVFLNDVFIMETYQTEEDTKYLFMTRYSQYSNDHSMVLNRDVIIFMAEATEIVKLHYERSVEYANKIADDKFMIGISNATKHLARSLEIFEGKPELELKERNNRSETSPSTKH